MLEVGWASSSPTFCLAAASACAGSTETEAAGTAVTTCYIKRWRKDYVALAKNVTRFMTEHKYASDPVSLFVILLHKNFFKRGCWFLCVMTDRTTALAVRRSNHSALRPPGNTFKRQGEIQQSKTWTSSLFLFCWGPPKHWNTYDIQ